MGNNGKMEQGKIMEEPWKIMENNGKERNILENNGNIMEHNEK